MTESPPPERRTDGANDGMWIAETNLRSAISKLICRMEARKTVLLVPEAVALNAVSLRIPARTYVLVAVSSDDITTILTEQGGGKKGNVSKYECPAGLVLMRGKFRKLFFPLVFCRIGGGGM